MKRIAGVDEVGRGCWAGPVVAAAVILGHSVPGLTDSKVLSKRRRQKLADAIYASGAAVGLGWCEPQVVDELGLTEAVRRAMHMAVTAMASTYEQIIVDGSYNFLSDLSGSAAIVKADLTEPAVSAASIIAKVARDEYMTQAAREFPGYHFEKHVGYGTKLHQQSLATLGPCRLHRLSYRPVQLARSIHD